MELINNNQVPEGYKKTEVGVIPEDWDVLPLGEITSFIGSGKSIVKSRLGDYPLYGSTGIITYSQKFEYQGDAILVARVGANAGKLNCVSGQYGVSDNTIIIKLKDNSNIHFFLYQLRHKNLNSLVFGSGQPLITGTQIKNLNVINPKASEQKAIAQTLSDVDALIDALDKLITKKRNIKTATMQQLLTGKTRLPGFGEGKGYKKTEVGVIPEDWKICILSELSQIVTGQTPPTHNRSYYGDEYLFVSPADIGSQKYITNTFAKLSKLGFSISRKYPSKTILFTCIGSTIGKCAIVVTESTSNQQINAILPSNLVNHQYLYYQLINNAKKIKNRAATQAVPIINKTEFGSTFIVVCSDEEQKAIAQVLCDIDTEITALEKRRAKTQAIKQGMMQELLTGKTRLINN